MSALTMPAVGPGLGGAYNSNSNNTDHNTDHAMTKRTSNTEEDAVHQRAMLVLQMATSVETSNNRRRRKLQQIESGTTDQVQQEIEDIMEEKPLDMMTLLKETDPEALPSAKELKERYAKKKDNEEESDDDEEDEDEEESDVDSEEDNEDKDKDEHIKEEDSLDADIPGKDSKVVFQQKQDLIVAASKQVPAAALANIPPETLQAHTEPLQEQLKRSYAAIVKLRENSDLRYQALEKKFIELKRNSHLAQGKSGEAVAATSSASTTVNAGQDGATVNKEQLNHAFQAIVRLRENSDLRYGVLESKYLDLKRSHAEADARNERLEAELEMMRNELAQKGGSSNNNNNQMPLNGSTNSFRNNMRGSNHSGMNNSFSSLLEQLPPSSAHGRKRYKRDKHSAAAKLQKMMVEFQVLCDKVTYCSTCIEHVPAATLMKVKQQLAKMDRAGASKMDFSGQNSDSVREAEDDADNEDESDEDKEEENSDSDQDTFANSFVSSKRHDGAMALLGANWDKLEKIEERRKSTRKSPGGLFANLSESKSEQKLRGKKSQFVAAQSGVYCRIDHNMQDQYGDLERFQAPQRPPPPPPPAAVAHVRREPPKLSPSPGQTALQSPPAIKRPSPPAVTDTSEQASATDLLRTPPREPVRENLASMPTKESLQISSEKSTLETAPTQDGKRRPVESPTSVAQTSQAFPVNTSPKPAIRRSNTPPHNGTVSFNSQVSTATIVKDEPPAAGRGASPIEENEPSPTRSKQMDAPTAPREGYFEAVPSSVRTRSEPGGPRAQGDMDASRGSVEMDVSRSSVTSAVSSSARPKRIPPAKLDAKEREAKRKAALKEAKTAAKTVRKDSGKSRKKGAASNVDDDSNSVVSNLSSDLAPKHKRASFLKNPFKKKSKSLETVAARTTGIPKVINEEAPKTKSKAVKQAPPPKIETKPAPGQSARSKVRSSATKTEPVEC